MRRVHRKDCVCPTTWPDSVRNALPDYPKFQRRAAAFERLDLNSAKRRAGFPSFAPETLVPKRGSSTPDFPGIWRKHKETIAAMSHRKCAYCEGPINAPAGAHVEHFQPKALFPSKAYDWANLFLGCPGCNGAKLAKWPKRGAYLRPDRGDPARHLEFLEDGTVEAARPNTAAARTVEDFGLKRKWLNRRRKFNIQTMLKSLSLAIQFNDEGDCGPAQRLARTLLESIDAPEHAYSVALTQCFWRVWKRACPSLEV